MTKPKLTKQARKEITELTAAALNGILADHQHIKRFKGRTCAESSTEWAALYGFETWLRLQAKFEAYKKQDNFQFPRSMNAY